MDIDFLYFSLLYCKASTIAVLYLHRCFYFTEGKQKGRYMMNSLDWEDSVRKWQTTMNTHQKNDSCRMENPSGTLGTHHTSCHYRADTVDVDPEDQELTGKLKELRGIEERKMCRKASPACKTVLEPSLGAPDEQSCRRTGTSLKERVNAILQQRQSNCFLSQVSF